MSPSITFFPVDNGDMTLLKFPSGKTVLIDAKVRLDADDPDEDTRDVAADLRNRLSKDAKGHRYVDALLLSHPDKDHCLGLERHFHLGAPADYDAEEDKIFIRQLWSSPMIFRRASKKKPLCDDAKAFNREARRRVELFKVVGSRVGDGNRILVLGEDEDGKTNGLEDILVKADGLIEQINGEPEPSMRALLLGPLPSSDDDEEEELSKNNSSVIIRFTITIEGRAWHFLTGGDAEVGIWERQWQRHRRNPFVLSYHMLQAPHHCSWHTLSYDSWSDLGEDVEVSQAARSALSQALPGARIISSSKPIDDDDNDPPCVRAKREYKAIVDAEAVSGEFFCTGEHPSRSAPAPLEFEVSRHGFILKNRPAPSIRGGGAIGREPLPHG